ncbi:MAG: hypothetical protein EXS00_04140 [Phycisphaerales bacterium]|nr:hypothetical protein [Phycisphaerales bacterium]
MSQVGESACWTVWPARRRPALALGAIALIVGFGLASALLAGDWFWGAIVSLVLVLCVGEFYLPSKCQLSEAGILASTPLRDRSMKWSEIRTFVWSPQWAWVSRLGPESKRGWQRASGFTLWFDTPQRAAQCRAMLGQDTLVREQGMNAALEASLPARGGS